MENIILKNLISNEDYFGKVFPELNSSVFKRVENAQIFNSLKDFVSKYETKPDVKELFLAIKNNSSIHESILSKVLDSYKEIMTDKSIQNMDFLLEETKNYVQKIELSDAIFKSADIIQHNEPFEQVIGLIENALSINFDSDVGLIYEQSALERYKYYTQILQGYKIGIPSIDNALGGGYVKKTLNLKVAPSHGGKSALLINDAAHLRLGGEDVLFISLEMTEMEIAKRVDANILGVSANNFKNFTEEDFIKRTKEIEELPGRMVIKEFPAGTFTTLKLKSLLNELETELGFRPVNIIIDYVGLMASARVTLAQSGGPYAYYKAIAEELHGFSKKEDKVIITAAQLNRGSYDNLEAGLDSIADSLGVIQTADTVLAILSNNQMRETNQALLKFLKNRNTGQLSSHLVDVDFSMARFIDVEDASSQSVNSMSAQIGVPELSAAVQQQLEKSSGVGDASVLNFS